MSEKTANEKVIKIEKCINILMSRERNNHEPATYKLLHETTADISNENLDRIKTVMRSMCYREDLDFVMTHLQMRGYAHEEGGKAGQIKINNTLFQDEADISQSVWSRYQSGVQIRMDHDTLLKIILALRLNEEEAHYYLSLTGSGFVVTDMVDRIVLSYIMLDYFGNISTVDIVNNVMELLDFYSEQEEKAGRKPLRRLYKL